MSFPRTAITALAFSTLWFAAASAEPCKITGPRYNLEGDTVNWSLEIPGGHSCVSGLRFANVAIQSVSLASEPIHGYAELKGWGFTYSGDAKIGQKDSFSIAVIGSISGKTGTSLIQVAVLVTAPRSSLASSPPRSKDWRSGRSGNRKTDDKPTR